MRVALLALATSAACAGTADNAALTRYREGSQALAEQRYEDARAALREAIRLNPDFAGAWLDLALATYAAGDPAQAEELLDILEARFEVPSPLAALIADLRQRIEAASTRTIPVNAWNWRRHLTAAVGHDSNANTGLAFSELTLTLPGSELVLPLAKGVRARADAFAQAGFTIAGQHRRSDGALDLMAGLNGRRNTEMTAFDTIDLRGSLAWQSAAPVPAGGLWGALPGPWRVRADVEQLRLGGSTLADQIVLGAEHLWPSDTCNPLAGVELEWLHYPAAQSLDAATVWLAGTVRCPAPLGPASQGLALQVRLGEAHARFGPDTSSARPGGDSHHLQLTVAHEWTWSATAGAQTLQAVARWERVRDTDGYSPLLSNGARRHLDRGTLSLTWTAPLPLGSDRGWRAVAAAQAFRQNANLRPFDLTDYIIQMGVEREW